MDENRTTRDFDAPVDRATAVDDAITSRHSMRRYLSTPVSRELVEHLLSVASRAPSGTNMQPWKVCAIGGDKKAALEAALVDASLNHDDEHSAEFSYYPDQFPEPYKSRRRKVGWDLYGMLEIGSWLDYGMFLENIMVAARGHGLHTCPQVAFSKYHTILRAHLDIPDEQIVICGMSIGYADLEAPENTLVTEREPVANFTRYFGL